MDMFRSPEEVWEQLLDPVLMVEWLGSEIRCDLREGGMISFYGEEAPTTAEMGDTWTLKRIRPGHAVLMGWEIMGVDTLVYIRLTRIGPGTQLELRHGSIPSSARPLHLPEHWRLLMANFRSVLELGEPAVRFNYREYRPVHVTRYDKPEVRASVLCRTPPSLPFDVWTNPEKLRHFLKIERPVVDRRFGGIYTWWGEGMGPVVFTRIVQDRELEFTWAYRDEPESRVNIRFEPVESSTLVSLHHYGFRDTQTAVGYNIGWSSVLAELKLTCELGESGIRVDYMGDDMVMRNYP